MTYNPDIHHRRSIRLKGYDYSSAGAYFISICTHGRECLFGQIMDGEMHLNDAGLMVKQVWSELPQRFLNVVLDTFVVMPNHFHGIVFITDNVGARQMRARQAAPLQATPALGKIMRAFKSISAIEVNRLLERQRRPLWQRNYYERVIRNDDELSSIREYIKFNPSKWEEDEEYQFP